MSSAEQTPTIVPLELPRPHRGVGRFLAAPFLFVYHHPGRALAIVALLALIALPAGFGVLYFWAQHHLEAARRAAERGHNRAAIYHLRLCRQVHPDHPEVLLLSARVARRSGAWTEAEALLDRYWQLRGDDDNLVLERLLLRATRGELSSAAGLLQARIDQDDPTAPLAREGLIAGLLFRYHLVAAEMQIDSWLQHDPDSTLALFYQGKLAEQREQASQALKAYRRLLEIDPEHDEARLHLAAILIDLNQGEEALPHLEYLHKRLPRDAGVLVKLAQALDLTGERAEARAALDECLSHHPDQATALAERGRIELRDGDSQQAEEYLRRAVRIDPGNPVTRFQLSRALIKNGKMEEADKEKGREEAVRTDIKRINEIVNGQLQKTPNEVGLYYEVAMIAQRSGLHREMHHWLLRALQVDPNHGPTHRALASYYSETGAPILAARHRAIAQRLNQQH